MALVFDNAALTCSSGNVNSRGLLLTAVAGAVLLVFTNNNTADSISAVNVGATQLGRLGTVNYHDAFGVYRAELWGLTAPATGVLTISAALVGAIATPFVLAGITYQGQITTATPFGGIAQGSQGAAVTFAASLIISSTVGNVAVCSWNYDDAGARGVGAGVTSRASTGQTVGSIAFNLGEAAGGASVNMSASCVNQSVWGLLGINLIASAAAGGSVWKFSLAQVGVGR